MSLIRPTVQKFRKPCNFRTVGRSDLRFITNCYEFLLGETLSTVEHTIHIRYVCIGTYYDLSIIYLLVGGCQMILLNVPTSSNNYVCFFVVVHFCKKVDKTHKILRFIGNGYDKIGNI